MELLFLILKSNKFLELKFKFINWLFFNRFFRLNWAAHNTIKNPKFEGNFVPGPIQAQAPEIFAPSNFKVFESPENNKSAVNPTYQGPEYTVN
jgi:hypothetical protein